MTYDRTRRRMLKALGLEAALLSAACHVPVAAGPVTAGAGADAPAAKPVLPPDPPEPPRRPRFPSCPSGEICVDAPPTKPATPAPGFATCEAVVPAPPPQGTRAHVTFDPARTAEARKSTPNSCCYRWVVPCPGGRALRDATGEAIAAHTAGRSDWAPEVDVARVVDEAAREALALHWAREAAFEHASVASFARTTLELLALGAPPELVAETQSAALDEVRHAQLLYGLARRYGAVEAGPGPVSSDRPLARDAAAFALATFHDACAGESISTLAARHAASLARDPAVAEVLATIADDEERHAELAWRTLAWALGLGGAEARAALADALAALEGEAGFDDAASEGGPLAAHGVLGAEAAASVRRRALAEVVLPCARALLAA